MLTDCTFKLFYLIIFLSKYEEKRGNQWIKLKTANMNPAVVNNSTSKYIYNKLKTSIEM